MQMRQYKFALILLENPERCDRCAYGLHIFYTEKGSQVARARLNSLRKCYYKLT